MQCAPKRAAPAEPATDGPRPSTKTVSANASIARGYRRAAALRCSGLRSMPPREVQDAAGHESPLAHLIVSERPLCRPCHRFFVRDDRSASFLVPNSSSTSRRRGPMRTSTRLPRRRIRVWHSGVVMSDKSSGSWRHSQRGRRGSAGRRLPGSGESTHARTSHECSRCVPCRRMC